MLTNTGSVADYLARAKACGIGWPLPEGITEQELYDKLFLPAGIKVKNRPLPEWPYIHQELRKKGVTLQLLWREYREQHPVLRVAIFDTICFAPNGMKQKMHEDSIHLHAFMLSA